VPVFFRRFFNFPAAAWFLRNIPQAVLDWSPMDIGVKLPRGKKNLPQEQIYSGSEKLCGREGEI